MIEITNLSKNYGKVEALKNVNLKIAAGEFVCLVGPSGAGKSTLIKLLIREEKPDSGKILIADRNIVPLNPNELPYYRRKIGTIFQDYRLLPQKTVAENIAFALEVCDMEDFEINKRVKKIIEMVGLEKKANSYPRQLSGC